MVAACRWSFPLILLVALLVSDAPPASAWMGFEAPFADPHPPLSWDEMLVCRRVFVGRYQAHVEGRLRLEVLRVLRGNDLKPGQLLTVALENTYRLQTRLIGEDRAWSRSGPELPQLLYGGRNGIVCRLGESRWVESNTILPDVREPAVYFLPCAGPAFLDRRGQVQPALLADGWQQVLDGGRGDLLFRLAQDVSAGVRRDALEELHATRDAATMDRLFHWMLNPPILKDFVPQEMLAAVGRGKRDVYDQAWQRLTAEDLARQQALTWVTLTAGQTTLPNVVALQGVTPPFPATVNALIEQLGSRRFRERQAAIRQLHRFGPAALFALRVAAEAHADPEVRLRAGQLLPAIEDVHHGMHGRERLGSLAELLVRTDPERALRDLTRLREGPRALRHLTVPAAGYLGTEQGIAFAADLLDDPELADGALEALALMVNDQQRGPRLRGMVCKYVRAALDAGRVHASIRPELEQFFRSLRGEPPALDLAAAEKVLMNADDPAYENQQTEDGAGPLLAELAVNVDSRVVPLLVKVLTTVPKAQDCACFRATFVHYGCICPHAVQRELRRCKPTEKSRTSLEMLDKQLAAPAPVLCRRDAPRPAPECHLRPLDDLPRVERFRNREQPTAEYLQALNALFPAHAGDYFTPILALLESPALIDRQTASASLNACLSWDLGLDAEAFAAERAEQLKTVRARVARLRTMSELDMRVFVLRELGVELRGTPSLAWLPVLKKAALSPEPAVAVNALRLLEDVARMVGCCEFLHRLAPERRERALKAMLRDWEVE